jgi:sec-independent protein translocase protein TatA
VSASTGPGSTGKADRRSDDQPGTVENQPVVSTTKETVMGSLGSSELIIILVVLLLLFGGAKLPQLARSLGSAQKEFKEGLKEGASDDEQADKS